MGTLERFFNPFGKIAGLAEDLEGFENAIDTSLEGINARVIDANRERIQLLNGFFDQAVSLLVPLQEQLSTAAARILIEELDSIVTGGLTALDVPTALAALRDELVAQSDHVEEATVAAAAVVYGASNIGDGKVVFDIQDLDGEDDQGLHAETIYVECTRDRQDAGTPGDEEFIVKGEAAVLRLGRLYPAGSGLNSLVKSVHLGIEDTPGVGGQFPKNSFSTFTNDKPDSWNIDVGVAGTHILKNLEKARGIAALEFKGDGSTRPRVMQVFGTDIASKLKSRSKYMLGIWTKKGAVAPTGTPKLRVSLRDTVDVQMSNAIEVLASTLGGATYAFTSAIINTPFDVPTDLELVVEITTADLSNGQSLLIDSVTLTEMYQDTNLKGTPRFAIVAGPTDWAVGDTATVAITRTGGKMLKYLEKLLGMANVHGITIRDTAPGTPPAYPDTLVS